MSDAGSEAGEKEEIPVVGIYEGERNGQKERHGKGKNTFPNGDTYEGSYANGKRNGQGVYKWKAGHRYKGQFLDNVRHGTGYFVYPDGSKYNGEFAEGKRNGHGVYLYGNGDVYQGEWAADVKHGKGTLQTKSGTYLYASGGKKSGVWVNGVLNGPGEIVHADHKIVGDFKNDYEMEMPVELIFPKTGYTKIVRDPNLLGLVPKSVTAE
ncbi:hypothetical protein HDV06_003618 [Boothiomyces sp. JEL0866]|nr:hypothetical protein HDV06_003618 [Boothiomyces sp. JEL0866]